MGTSLGLFYLNTDGAVTLLARDADGNWSAEQSLGGRSVTDITAVYVPETQTVQLFYQGVSDGVYSRWRTPDGTWSDEQHIGGNPYYPGGTPGQYLCAPIAAAGVPGTEVLQLFYCGDDGSIRSMWRNPDGSWAAETNLGGSLQQGLTYITAAQVPGTYTLQLFYPSAESVLSSIWRNADGSWSAEQDLGSSNIGAVTAVPIQGNGTLQLFYPPAINNGAPLPLRSRVRNPDGSWSAELDLGGTPSFSWPNVVAAVWLPGLETLQLFYTTVENWSLETVWQETDGTWSGPQSLGVEGILGPVAAAVVPYTDTVQLFMGDWNGNITSMWRNPDGSWSDLSQLPGTKAASSRIAVTYLP